MILENKKSVFFGPFVGEFGWELLFWHGWVKKMCRTRFKDCYKIACSYPGRKPFYPDVDEFWSLPDSFLKNKISSRGYITDCWINGYPKPSVGVDLPNIFPLLEKVIEDLKNKLPPETEFIFPWELRYDKEDSRQYGVKIKNFPTPNLDKDFISYAIPFQKQILDYLNPTIEGIEELKKILNPKEKLIIIFPRRRSFRRPDKNWPEENYTKLIKLLQEKMPDFKVAISGEPEGAYFSQRVPDGCIDLININPNLKMDIQLAALRQAEIAVGSQSGAISFAMAAGARVLSWGEISGEKFFAKENYMHSPMFFLPNPNPSPQRVFNYIRWIVVKGNMPLDNFLRMASILFFRFFNPRYLAKIKMKICQKEN